MLCIAVCIKQDTCDRDITACTPYHTLVLAIFVYLIKHSFAASSNPYAIMVVRFVRASLLYDVYFDRHSMYTLIHVNVFIIYYLQLYFRCFICTACTDVDVFLAFVILPLIFMHQHEGEGVRVSGRVQECAHICGGVSVGVCAGVNAGVSAGVNVGVCAKINSRMTKTVFLTSSSLFIWLVTAVAPIDKFTKTGNTKGLRSQ